MKTYYLALDLKDDATLIESYEKYHKKIWPEITKSIIDSGIASMKIYRVSNRLVMIMETNDDFSFTKKSEMDKNNSKVAEWEQLMLKYQQIIPGSAPGEKWRLMTEIFDLSKNG